MAAAGSPRCWRPAACSDRPAPPPGRGRLPPMTADPGQPADAPPARIHRGDVFWIAPAEADEPTPAYSHPYVVVQDDVFNHSRLTTVIVCALTSNLHRANEPGNVLLDLGE